MSRSIVKKVVTLSVLLISISTHTLAERLKDISNVQGVRANQLVGYGLVVGLDGTGDKAPFTNQSFKNMMQKFGVTIPDGVDPKLKNVAAVSIHAELPAFTKPGQKIDITISSIGNASSLRGGSLLMSPMKGADGQIYAVAQGNLIVGGFSADGADGSSITVNIPSAGRIPDGAIVERSVPTNFNEGDSITFNLHNPDFTTAKRLVDQINDMLGPDSAYALDASSIRVIAPRDTSQRVNFLSVMENLDVKPGEQKAKIIINSRTGTIVIGKHVTVDPVAVTHGSLTVTISENLNVSQPNAFANGETVVTPDTQVAAAEENKPMFLFKAGTTLDEIVRAVNEVGASPSDLMAILEAMKQAGALKAELIVI